MITTSLAAFALQVSEELLQVSDVNYFVRFASIILAGLLTFVSLLDSSFVGRDYVRLLAGK